MKRIKNVLIFFLAMVMLGACRDKSLKKKRRRIYSKKIHL